MQIKTSIKMDEHCMTNMTIRKLRSRRIQTRTKGKRKMKRAMKEANERMEKWFVEQIAAAFGVTLQDLTAAFN